MASQIVNTLKTKIKVRNIIYHKQTSKHSAQDLDDDRRKYEDLSEQRRAELSRERRGTEEVEAEVLALQRKVGTRAGNGPSRSLKFYNHGEGPY